MLVSEYMAQQTQVSRVVPAYHAFLERFPTPGACAAAPAGAVVQAWSGLGYNRRAIHLHGAATAIVERHDGAVPDDLDALLALPGVGPYTARAVLAFAFEREVGAVDTNIGRVLARLANRTLSRREVQRAADAAVPPGRSWAWNQSLMELGATVCTARQPSCDACPLTAHCGWHAAGRPEPDPARGSACVSMPQSRFHGSDRQGRGRLVAALRHGPIDADQLATVMGWPDDSKRAQRVAATVVADGLARVDSAGRFLL